MRWELAIHRRLESPWLELPPVRTGDVPAGLGTPDRFLLLSNDGRPHLRVDHYVDAGDAQVFEAARLWQEWIVLGLGERVCLVHTITRESRERRVAGYFGSFYPTEACLLIASAADVTRVDPDGEFRWTSTEVGIDGVRIEAVERGTIQGSGDWDPPGGWHPFTLDLETGVILRSSW